ncbi:MAG: radical SAM (seleno)protein TrsS [Anaerovoracaceae bacterium]|jgi:uncharacterized radical SAM superfamily Fe-S cluster-containing enzyme
MVKILSETKSICPVCLKTIYAVRVLRDGKIYLEKECAQHGFFRVLIWEGEQEFLDWKNTESNSKPEIFDTEVQSGCPHDCGLCPKHQQQACCVLIEVTNRCNQNCPYCFAESEEDREGDLTPSEIKKIYRSLLNRSKDRPFNIQLSGGEPTVRDDLPYIINMGKNLGFPYIQLNTNGVRLAEEEAYCRELKQVGLSSVFLQFDGTNDEIYEKIRGQKILNVKTKAIENLTKVGLSIVLVVTVVPGINDSNVGEIIKFAAEGMPYIRGIHFQPVSYFGRFPKEPKDEDRITLQQLIHLIEKQTNGQMKREQFIPLSTGHSFCSFHGRFVVMEDGSYHPISAKPEAACCEKTAIIKARDYIKKQWEWQKTTNENINKNNKLSQQYDFSEWDKYIERIKDYGMSITAMGFQDCWNLDLERLQKCRVHVAVKSGKLIPFCAYNNIYRSKGE